MPTWASRSGINFPLKYTMNSDRHLLSLCNLLLLRDSLIQFPPAFQGPLIQLHTIVVFFTSRRSAASILACGNPSAISSSAPSITMLAARALPSSWATRVNGKREHMNVVALAIRRETRRRCR